MQVVSQKQFCCIATYNYVWAISNFLAMVGVLTTGFLVAPDSELSLFLVLFFTWMFSWISFVISCVVIAGKCRTAYQIKDEEPVQP